LYRRVNEAAALAGLGQAVEGPDRSFRQDDIDARAHLVHMIYTTDVYVKACPVL
jgi:hypothetical protein